MLFPSVDACGQTSDLIQSESRAFEDAASQVQNSVLQIETFFLSEGGGNLTSSGPTSATIVAPGGFAITSLFSMRGEPASILARLPDGTRRSARLIARDYSRELALLQIDGYQGPVPTFADSGSVQVGQWAIALGKTYDPTTAARSVGIISALGRAYGKAVQTDAKVSPINYGGPLIDIAGNVIGILTPLSPGAFLQGDSSELYDSGIGFAVTSEEFLPRIATLAKGDDIHSGKLGVVVKDLNELVGPVRLTGTAPGSPAAKSGLLAEDIIVEAGGMPIDRFGELKHALAKVDAGQDIDLRVQRGEETVEVRCTLAKTIPLYRKRMLGLHLLPVQSLDTDPDDDKHFLVTHVAVDSPAAKAGIEAGSILKEIFGRPATTIGRMRELLSVAELDEPIGVAWENADGTMHRKDVLPIEWENQTPQLPPPPFKVQDESDCEVIEIKLNDKPNNCFAIVPPIDQCTVQGYSAIPFSPRLGVLVVVPRPGDVAAEPSLEFWRQFCIEYGWIVAVINSADKKRWNREELEIPGRVLQRLKEGYRVASDRIVLSGFSSGGQLAFLANTELKGITGVALFSTTLPPFGLNKRNSPGETLSFFLAGDEERVKPPTQILQKAGFPATSISLTSPVENWNDLPKESFHAWLAKLRLL